MTWLSTLNVMFPAFYLTSQACASDTQTHSPSFVPSPPLAFTYYTYLCFVLPAFFCPCATVNIISFVSALPQCDCQSVVVLARCSLLVARSLWQYFRRDKGASSTCLCRWFWIWFWIRIEIEIRLCPSLWLTYRLSIESFMRIITK